MALEVFKFGESDIEIGEDVARIPAARPLEKSGGFRFNRTDKNKFIINLVEKCNFK